MVERFSNVDAIAKLLAVPCTVLILGGIREAADLADMLFAAGHTVISSLAGRTKEPMPLAGDLRVGGFGGPQGLAQYITDNAIDVVLDATHPFALKISANALIATRLAKCRLVVYARAAWQKQAGDHWIDMETLEAARDALPSNARVLLALGSQHIAPFSSRNDVHFIVRMVDLPVMPVPLQNFTLVLGKPGDRDAETQLLQNHSISHIVCRNSGGVGAYAKIEAARCLNLPVIIINR